MYSSKLINKIKDSQVTNNKKQPVSTLRKKISVFDHNTPLDIEESYLEFSIKNKKQVGNHKQPSAKKQEITTKKDCLIAPTNKIYRANNNHLLEHSNQSSNIYKIDKGSKATTKNQMQIRPRSSNVDKYQKSIEIIPGIHIENGKHQVRPGSSKSSRLFKKKSTLVNDDMEGDNIQDDSFIKVTNRERDALSSSNVRQKQRIGTSMSKKTRGGDKFQSKLDPQFFSLFAS